jgi:hypothetical protein
MRGLNNVVTSVISETLEIYAQDIRIFGTFGSSQKFNGSKRHFHWNGPTGTRISRESAIRRHEEKCVTLCTSSERHDRLARICHISLAWSM